MENQIKLNSRLLDLKNLPKDILYIGSVGFEDRAMGFFNDSERHGKHFKNCVAITYQPFNSRNSCIKFEEHAPKIFEKIIWKTYDRKCPESFDQSIEEIITLSKSVSQIVIDISGMSKMLIVVLLYGLRNIELPVSIIYSAAEQYFPLKEDYEKERQKSNASDYFPYFLTTDVYNVVTTSKLSSIAMQDAPLAIIAFPNFNYLEISALLNETNAQKLFLIESVKNPEQNAWRIQAIRWLNRGVSRYVTPLTFETDASDINANIDCLERIYEEWHLTHKVAISPTGGKMQAVAVFCLKIMHPDIHIIYPVVREFAEGYTMGHLKHQEIFFPNFSEHTKILDQYRRRGLLEIKRIIQSKGIKPL